MTWTRNAHSEKIEQLPDQLKDKYVEEKVDKMVRCHFELQGMKTA